MVTDVAISPTAICADISIPHCTDDVQMRLCSVYLIFDWMGINGTVRVLYVYEGELTTNDMIKHDDVLFYSCRSPIDLAGIHTFDLAVRMHQVNIVQQGIGHMTMPCDDTLIVCDSIQRYVRLFEVSTRESRIIAGSGQDGHRDGCGTSCRFTQPYGINHEGKTLYVTDPSSGRICLISNMDHPMTQSSSPTYTG